MGLIIYMIISTFLGFCGVADSVRQPGQAFRAAGRSKSFWVLVNILGMITLVGGVVTWAVYSYGGARKGVVKNGGYNRSREIGIRQMRRDVNREDRAQRRWDERNNG